MSSRTAMVLIRSLSPSQYAWGIAGLAVVILVAFLAISDLQAIYDARKDFVVGSLLSLAGFCLGKASSRTEEQKAIELIRTKPTTRIENELRAELSVRLHERGAFEEIAVLARNVDATMDRLSEYYYSQSQDLAFYRRASLLRVSLDDLDKTAVNVDTLQQMLDPSSEQAGDAISAEQAGDAISASERIALAGIRRDLREAVGRRNQAYEWFSGRLGMPLSTEEATRRADEEVWDVFAVMTADVLKADRLLDALLNRPSAGAVRERTQTVVGYLDAALRRAHEFEEIINQRQIGRPKIFDVMLQDLTGAATALKRIGLGEPAATEASSPAAGGLRTELN